MQTKFITTRHVFDGNRFRYGGKEYLITNREIYGTFVEVEVNPASGKIRAMYGGIELEIEEITERWK